VSGRKSICYTPRAPGSPPRSMPEHELHLTVGSRFENVELVQAAALLETLEGIAVGTYLADQLVHFSQENDESHRLCRLLATTLAAIGAGVELGLATRYFEIWILRLAGIFPVPRDCPLCDRPLDAGGRLALEEDAILCPDCGGSSELSLDAAVVDLLRRSGAERPEELARIPPSPATLLRVEEICSRVRRAFLGHELRSYRVMRQMLEPAIGGGAS